MRITILSFSILLTIGLLSVSAADVHAQSLDQRVNIKFGHESLYNAIKKIEQNTNLVFAYDADYLGLKERFVEPSNFNAQPLENVLTALLRGTNIVFKESSGNILLTKKLEQGKVYGKVTDETGEPLAGANVRVAGWHILKPNFTYSIIQ
jgi:hypothetical protein